MKNDSRARELVEHVQALRRYAQALARNPTAAEDMVQECLARAIAGLGGFRAGAPVRPWLLRILHNVYMSEQRHRFVEDDHRPRWAAGNIAEAAQPHRVELRETIQAVYALPPSQREPILLIALEELSYEETARVLDIPLGTLMSRLARGRESLRRILAGETLPKLRVVGDKK